MNDPIWVCRDGTRLRAGQMTNEHLFSSIMLIRKTGWRQHWLPRLLIELRVRAMGGTTLRK